MERDNAVVQVFVQSSEFNWAEPYKSKASNDAFGSAFFIDEQGHLVSNFHVVTGVTAIQIQVPSMGKQRLNVEVVGVCPFRDLVLLKLTEASLEEAKAKLGTIPFLERGSSDDLKRSEKVITLGYPLGHEALKATQGIVSGRQDILGESFVQITAALNPGNSGGPCLNEAGKVVGINSAVDPQAQNIGYIIPISDVHGIINDLFNIRLLRSPILGCELNYGTKDMLEYFGNPEPGGLYVARTYQNSLFERAGILEGDMIYQVNGYDVGLYGDVSVPWCEDQTTLSTVISRFRIGEKVGLVLYRKGKKVEVEMPFELLEPLPVRIMFPGYESIDYEVVGGLVVMSLSLNHVAQLGGMNPFLVDYRTRVMQHESRVVVSAVLGNSQSYNSRIVYPGDVLETVNDCEIHNLEDFRKALQQPSDFITVKVRSRKFMVLSRKKVLEEEEGLAVRNLYQITELVKGLLGK